MLQAISYEHDQHRATVSGAPPAFKASDYGTDGKKHLLLAASGSVATIKIPNIVQALSSHPNLSVRIILTASAINFLASQSSEQPTLETIRKTPNVDSIFLDEEEWVHPWKRGNPILHIELRRWADILVIVPLSTNTLAKVTGGFSDNLLTSVVRAWDTTGLVEAASVESRKRKSIVVAPAMNTAMWRHPITQRQIRVLEEEWGIVGKEEEQDEGWFEVLRPQEEELMGDGTMKDWREIVEVIEQRLGL